MSVLKTGLIAASLCLAASFAHAGAGAPMQGQMSWMSWNNAAKSAYASAPRMAKTWAKTWTNSKAMPFSREAMENKSGH
ncbi:MAG TPA: hypothetical protein VJL90_13980 [Pseudorhodoplanes sp.]|nr:hypothetical protein [Pseudorhodoplanes sp.]